MEKEIGKIGKNDTTDIILRIDDFGGRRGLTIREFVTSDRYTGFTKSGVRIMAEDFAKFKEMINSIPEEDMKEASGSESGEASETLEEKTGKVPTENPGSPESNDELPDY